jgi:molybdate transport system substrate-binding protein
VTDGARACARLESLTRYICLYMTNPGLMRRVHAIALVVGAVAFMASATARGDRLLVFAAASLRDALDAQIQQHGPFGGTRVVASYAATSTLAKQIERGAPADLFISADVEWMDYLSARGLLNTKSRVQLLSNRLVLVSPVGEPIVLSIRTGFPLRAALGGGRLALADPGYVPAGKYARAALEKLGVWAQVSDRITRSENVRAALALVARSETPLGIVYATDALAEKRVRVVSEFPTSSYPPIVYPAALTASSRSAAGPALLNFLRSAAARAIWSRFGFSVLD